MSAPGCSRIFLRATIRAPSFFASTIPIKSDRPPNRSTRFSKACAGSASNGTKGPPDRKYFQSSRFERYRESALKLLREGKAYPCYCTTAELDAMRKAAEREHRKPGYDGRCRDRTTPADLLKVELPDKKAGRNYTIRFRSPREGTTVVDDLIKGRAVFENTELDDLIIFRSDGVPTYNFATVLDDSDFGMTHVVRGDDHLPNTPRQMQIFYALGLTPPAYAHLPMVMGPDGQKLSKRHGATSVFAYRDLGYFPEALLNYLVRLGWSHGDQEIFSLQEMFDYFDFANCGKSAGIFNAEKLLWLNFHYMKELPLARLVHDVKPFIALKGWTDSRRRRLARTDDRDACASAPRPWSN